MASVRSLLIARPRLIAHHTFEVNVACSTQKHLIWHQHFSTAARATNAAAETTQPFRARNGALGFVAGGVLGCGICSPLGSIVGMLLHVSDGSFGVSGLISGAVVGGISGGGIGAVWGFTYRCGLGVPE